MDTGSVLREYIFFLFAVVITLLFWGLSDCLKEIPFHNFHVHLIYEDGCWVPSLQDQNWALILDSNLIVVIYESFFPYILFFLFPDIWFILRNS